MRRENTSIYQSHSRHDGEGGSLSNRVRIVDDVFWRNNMTHFKSYIETLAPEDTLDLVMIRHQPLYKGIKVALSVVFCVGFLEIIVCAFVHVRILWLAYIIWTNCQILLD